MNIEILSSKLLEIYANKIEEIKLYVYTMV